MGYACRILKHGRFNYFEGEMNDFLDVYILTIEGRDARENVMFYPSRKTFDQSNSIGKFSKCLCDPLDGSNSIVEHLYTFGC